MKIAKKGLCLLISVLMLISTLPVVSFASDYENHWAKDSINLLLSQGVISGYTDGTVKPDSNILRAEFVKVINNYFGYKGAAHGNFQDVDASKWYANDFAIAKTQGYITGDNYGNANPEAYITRAEVCVIFSKILGLPLNYNLSFADNAYIPDWAKGYIGAMVNKGLISGYTDGTVKATNNIARGEAFSIVTRTNRSSAATGNTGNTSSMVSVNTSGGSGSGGGSGSSSSDEKKATISLNHFDPETYEMQLVAKNADHIDLKIVVGDNAYQETFTLPTTLVSGLYKANIMDKICEIVDARINPEDIEATNNEKYTLSANAVGKSGYDDSGFTKLTVATVKYERLADVQPVHEMFKDEQKVVVTWPAVPKALTYDIKVFNEAGTEITDTSDVSIDKAARKVEISNVANVFADKYKLKVVTVGENLVFSSNEYGGIIKEYDVDLGVLTGSGTILDPYIIKYGEQLPWIANDNDANYVIVDNLSVGTANVVTGTFTGTLKGKLNGVEGKAPVITLDIDDSTGYAGIFKALGSGANVSNLVLAGDVAGTGRAGALAAEANGATVTNCVNNADVTTDASYAGGFIGAATNVTITRSSNTGKITADDKAGGIAGELSGEISECYNLGEVTGTTAAGITSSLNGTKGIIKNCYNAGKVSGLDIAGIVYNVTSSSEIDIEYNYNIAASSGIAPVVGVVNDISNIKVLDNYYSDVVGFDSVAGTIVNKDGEVEQPKELKIHEMNSISAYLDFPADVWEINSAEAYKFPQLKANKHANTAATLAAVNNIAVNGTTVSFDAVDNAAKYLVLLYSVIGELEFWDEVTAREISAESGLKFKEDYNVYVVALADGYTSTNYSSISYFYDAGLARPTPVNGNTFVASYAFTDGTGASDAGDSETVTISWDAVTGADSYKVTVKNELGLIVHEQDNIPEPTYTYSFADNGNMLSGTLVYEVQTRIGPNLSLVTVGEKDIMFGGGSGTDVDPYIIYTARQYMNLTNNYEDYKESNFLQCADIYTPVTNSIAAFKGSYIGDISDGSTHRMLKVNIEKQGAALLGGMVDDGCGAEIRNIRLNGYITMKSPSGNAVVGSSTVMGFGGFVAAATTDEIIVTNCINEAEMKVVDASGALMGFAGNEYGGIGGIIGIIRDMTDMSNAVIDNCINTADINSKSYNAGGIIGCSAATITNCANSGNINSGNYSGGIVGQMLGGTILRCSNSGNVTTGNSGGGTGGIAGYIADTRAPYSISECYNSGTHQNNNNGYVGGIVGLVRIGNTATDGLVIDNCLNVAEVKAKTPANQSGGIVGNYRRGPSLTIYNCINLGVMKNIICDTMINDWNGGNNSPVLYLNASKSVNAVIAASNQDPLALETSTNYYEANDVTTGKGGKALNTTQMKAILGTDSSFDSSIWEDGEDGYPKLKNAPDLDALALQYGL